MFRVELRAERPRIIPERIVGDLHLAVALHPPGQLVQLLNRGLLTIHARRNPLHMAAEIADLIKRIPRRHLQIHVPLHVRHFHRYMEKMLFRMLQRNRIANFSVNGSCEGKYDAEENEEPQAGQQTNLLHRAFTPLVGCTAVNFWSNFSQSPSKLPFDIISTKSPGLASAVSNSAIGSAPANTWASFPSARTPAATAS